MHESALWRTSSTIIGCTAEFPSTIPSLFVGQHARTIRASLDRGSNTPVPGVGGGGGRGGATPDAAGESVVYMRAGVRKERAMGVSRQSMGAWTKEMC